MDTSRIERELKQADWRVAPPHDLREQCLPTDPILAAHRQWRITPMGGVASGAIAAAVIVGFILWSNNEPRTAFAAERAFDQAESTLGSAQRLIYRQSLADHPEDAFVIWVDRKLGYRMAYGDKIDICDLRGGHVHHVQDNGQYVLTLDWAKPDLVEALLGGVGYDAWLRAARTLATKHDTLVNELAIDEPNGALWRVSVGDEYLLEFDEQLRLVRLERGPVVETYEYPAQLDAGLFAEPDASIPRVSGTQREVQQCQHNIKDLSFALYGYYDKHGAFPETLAELQRDSEANARLLHCPGSSLSDDTSYILHHPESLEPVGPIVECHAHGALRVVGFTDGHTEILPRTAQ